MSKPKIYEKTCPNCRKLFIAHRKDKVFCTPRCKFDYWVKKKNIHPFNLPSISKEERAELKKLREQDNWKKLGHIVK